MFFVYFLQSQKNKKYYCGSTSKHPESRLVEHNQHSNTWTKQNGPFTLIYYESYHCKKDAIAREYFYKTGVGRKIRNAILNSAPARGGSASGRG